MTDQPQEEKKKRATKAEQAARIEAVRQLICSGATRQNILRFTSEKFDVSERTADDLIAKATQLIADTPLPDKITQKKHMIDQLNRIRYKAETMLDFQRVVSTHDRLMRLMGLEEPAPKQTIAIEGMSEFSLLAEHAAAAGTDVKSIITMMLDMIGAKTP